MNTLTDYALFAQSLADIARPIAARYFRSDFAVERKADESPVTKADQDIEAAIRTHIKQHYPQHGIVGEEHGSENESAEYVWVIDPIDGTRAFISGKPSFTTLIALCHKGSPVIGVIDQAITEERWLGISGKATLFNGAPIQTRSTTHLGEAILSTTSPDYFSSEGKKALGALRQECRDIVYGGDGYAYGLLAMGGVDIILESGLKPYDFCALRPVIEGAGGKVTDWAGAPIHLRSSGDVLATASEQLHCLAIESIQLFNKQTNIHL